MLRLSKTVSPDVMEELRKAFKEFDVNGDGSISKEELATIMKNFDSVVSEEELEAMVKNVDSDGDGGIDFNEFIALMESNFKNESAEQETKNLFRAIDTDNDGFITKDEIKKMMKKQGEKISKKDIKKMMKEGDGAKKGKITYPEFKKMIEGLTDELKDDK